MPSNLPVRPIAALFAALSVVLGTAGPAAAAAATVAETTIGLRVAVTKDGNGPFTANDGPGGDANDSNGIVRTLDAVTYTVTTSANGGPSVGQRFVLTAPAGTTWAGLPASCTAEGSRVDGRELHCGIGDLREGQAIAVPAVLDISSDLQNGDVIDVTAAATADNSGNGVVEADAPRTTVSAAARYDLSKNINASVLTPGFTGPGGERGIRLVYPIAVTWEPVVPGQGLLGFEKSVGPMTFTDDPSEILGDLPSRAQLWNGSAPACGVNEVTEWRMSNLPGGRGGGARNVVDSGTIECSQAAPGDDIDVTISGTVTDPARVPTQSVGGGPIAGGDKAYFVSGYISVWMPYPPTGTSVVSVNEYSPLQTTSASGAQNYPGSTEPMANNTASRNIVELGPGSAGKRLYRAVGGTVVAGSAKAGDPWATKGDVLRSEVTVHNDGIGEYRGTILCDTFDRTTQRLTRAGTEQQAAWVAGLADGEIEYAAYDMGSAASGQQQACGDADLAWYADPDDVPGGIAGVGAVRATGDVLGGTWAVLYSRVTVEGATDGTRAHDFGHVLFGDHVTTWTHDTSVPEVGAGGLADSVLITENLARTTKKIVDPGHDAGTTPDRTSFTVAGTTLEYALYPTLTNGNTTGRPTTVTVRDVLPLHSQYVPDSASVRPTVIDTVADDAGKDHQRLTWEFSDVEPNVTIDPITYEAHVSALAPAGPMTNRTSISSPSDKSEQFRREAERAVQIVNTGGIGVEKRATEPVVATGDPLEWELGYTNTDASNVHGLDLIDVLPYVGDPQRSDFHGSLALAAGVAVDRSAGETVRYTTAEPGSVSLDPEDPSNRPGGSTVWCAAEDFGKSGCASSFSAVTAFRIERTSAVQPGATVNHHLSLVTTGQQDGDTYVNRFGLRASNLALPVRSNPASIRVASGAIGDLVWTDTDRDGLQDDDEQGQRGVGVHLAGTDDRGDEVSLDTVTDADGTYSFDGLRPGAYVATFRAPDGRQFTREHVGNDDAVDSDADGDGVTGTVVLDWIHTPEGAKDVITRDQTVDVGIVPAAETVSPEVPTSPADGAGPGSAAGPADPGPGTAADQIGGRLAFTGSGPVVAGIVSALFLVLIGSAVLRRRRRAVQR